MSIKVLAKEVPRKSAIRASQIVYVVSTHLLLYPINSHRREGFGLRLRKACESLGGAFIKIGQILSGRYDLFEEADLVELRKLLDDTTRVSDEVMFAILSQDLKEKLGRFKGLTFLSSASIAQVYAATLDDGQEVVVKVLKPGVGMQMGIDIILLYWVARVVEFFSPTLRRLKAAQTVAVMGSWILEEIDLVHELNNVEQFRVHLARYFPTGQVRDLGMIIVPKTYPEVSTKRVLTMEFLHGITANRLSKESPEHGYDPRVSILTLLAGSFRPLFVGEPCLFHGDPHPANIIFMENGNVGLIDFGLVGHYSEESMPGFREMFFACYIKNAGLFTESLMRFVNLSSEYYDQLCPDVTEFLKDAVDRRLVGMLMGLLEILKKHKLSAPRLLPILAKFNLLIDGLVARFCPEYSVADMLKEEFVLALFPDLTADDAAGLITELQQFQTNFQKKLLESPEERNQF